MFKEKRFICVIIFTFLMVGLLPNNLFAVVSEGDNSINGSFNTWKKIYSAGGICVGLLDDNSLWEWCTFPDNSTILKQNKFASPVKMLENVSDVSIGQGYILALTQDNNLWSWGTNKLGELGDGSNTDRIYPQNIMNGVIKISTGKDSSTGFAIKDDGSLWGWGNNTYGQLGNGTNENKNTPTLIEITKISTGEDTLPAKENAGVKSVVSSARHTLAIMDDNSLWAWGDNNYGQLGNGTYDNSYVPVKIMDKVDKIAMDNASCFAIKEDSTLWSWGNNDSMQLGGDKSSVRRNKPQEVLNSVSDVVTSPQSTYAITTDKTLYAWGYDSVILSDPKLSDTSSPAKIMDNISKLSAYYHVLAVDENGSLWAWGNNASFQLGSEPGQNITYPKLLSENISEIATDYNLSSFITYDGSLFQLGDIGGNSISTPYNIAVPPYIDSIYVYDNYMNIQFSGTIPKTVHDSDFTVSYTVTDEYRQTVTSAVYSSVYSFDPNTGTTVLQLGNISYDNVQSISYAASYRGNLEVQAPITATPAPSPYATPTPGRTKSNQKSEPATVIYPKETVPGPIPQETPVAADINYEKVLQNFKADVIETIEKYKNIDDIYNEKNSLITKTIEKAIEKAASMKVICETGSIEITQDLISPQIELALKASREIEDFLKTQDYEPNRIYRKRINLYMDSTETQLNINLFKDIAAMMKKGIDVKIASSFSNIIVSYENIDKLLSNDLTISMADESKTENAKIKSEASLEFKYENDIIKEKLDHHILLELPYKDGNPYYCTIYNEPTYYSYDSNGQKDTKTLLAVSSNTNKIQTQKSEYGSGTSEYSTAYGTSSTKSYNMGGHEDTENKTLSVNIVNSGKYYVIEEKITFNDIKHEDTAIREAIEALASKGIINGRGNGSFCPDDQLSRSEFTCLIVRSLNITDDNASVHFEDVRDSSWYYNSVAIAYNEGLIVGYGDNTFKGNQKINRQEIITICATTLNTKKGYLFPDGDEWLNFTDKDVIPSWVRKFVSLGNREGLIVKRSDGKFNGAGLCTRKDAAIILYRLYKKL